MNDKKKTLSSWDKVMMAITFAEAGEANTAKDILAYNQRPGKRVEKQNENRPQLRA